MLNQSDGSDYSDNSEFGAYDSLTFQGSDRNSFTTDNTGVTCFAAGTAIRTPSGDAPIETLAVGDLVDTQDREDHTFCGVMFDLQVRSQRPIDFVQIEQLWVRGGLGGMTVWATQGGFANKHEDESQWTKVYEKHHGPR